MESVLNYYPETQDSEFYEKITKKKEFYDTRYKEGHYDKIKIEDKCDSTMFNIENHQVFLSRFMSPSTPYKSLLLFHGVGTGKTCAAITIAEGFKKSLTSIRKRVKIARGNRNFEYFNYPGVYIIVGPAIQKVFRNEFYSMTKKEKEEIPGILHCTGNEYFTANDDSEYSNSKIQVTRNILSYYKLFGPSEFSNFVRDIKKEISVQEFFSNSIFIVDEVHNVLEKEKEDAAMSKTQIVSTVETLKEIFAEAQDTRLILLSATPMRNDQKSIVNIISLLRENDKKFENVDIEKLFPSENSVNDEYLKELFKGYVSYLRGNNPVSFPTMKYPSQDMVYNPSPKYSIDGTEYFQNDKMYTLFKCPMLKYQFDTYKDIITKEGRSVLKLWEALTIVYPDNKVGDPGFNNSFSEKNGTYTYKKDEDFLNISNIEDYSIKIFKLLNLSKEKGLHYIYSQFDKSGAHTIALAFEMNGYMNYHTKGSWNEQGLFIRNDKKRLISNSFNVQPRCGICGNLRNEYHTDHNFKQGTFLLFTGQTNTPDGMSIFNSAENKDGHIIKFMIGSQVSSEGVDYKRIKHVHIINPWHNFTRIWQAIGRGLRNCSQADFPENERNVVVYLYSATVPEKNDGSSLYNVETQDEKSYALSLEKDFLIKNVERSLKEISVDCALNKHANMYASDKDYSRECDYKKCSYVCEYNENLDELHELDQLDIDTYTIKYNDPIIQTIKNNIFKLYKTRSYYSLQEIIEKLSHNSIMTTDHIYVALSQLLSSRSILKDEHGRNGRLIYKNSYYVYQPDEFNDKTAPIRYKERPIDYKVTSLETMPDPSFKVTQKIAPKAVEKSEIKQTKVSENSYEEKIKNILSQSSPEKIMYFFDRNDNDTIESMIQLILRKSTFINAYDGLFVDNCLVLLKHLHKIGFVLKEKFNKDYHNEDIHFVDNGSAYVGYKSPYWAIKGQVQDKILKIVTKDNTVSNTVSLLRKDEINTYNTIPNVKFASTNECRTHGIVKWESGFKFKLYFISLKNLEKLKNQQGKKDNRLNPIGRVADTMEVPVLAEIYQCLSKIETSNRTRAYMVEEIELLLRKYDYENKDNLKWVVKN